MSTVELARATSERGDVVLRRRDHPASDDETTSVVFELRANGVFVMDTANTHTEIELAAQALELVAQPRRVLIGGLGLGFTARAVLSDPRVEGVDVVEIEPALISWLSADLVPGGAELLAEERLKVICADLADVLAHPPQRYDLALLDVDNGPGYLVHEANENLYRKTALGNLKRLLNPGGTAVIWSAAESDELLGDMRSVFGSAEAHRYPVKLGTREECYFLYQSLC